jgi:DNA-binding response OmpR family regulator
MPIYATILLVDDHEPTLQSLGMVFRFSGYDVMQANSAALALDLLRDRVPDAVVMDYHMPGGGDELGREIRARYPAVPIMVLSGDPGSAAGSKFADTVVGKPERPNILLERVRQMIESARSSRAA